MNKFLTPKQGALAEEGHNYHVLLIGVGY